MKAEVRVSEIGPFKGSYVFELDSSLLNVVEAPNASGKSSLIKGMAALVGLPVKSRLAYDVGRRLGIIPLNPDDRNPLVNMQAEEGIIELRLGNQTRRLTARAHGPSRNDPAGNEKFLFTGLLVRESEIVRRLDDGSDDFSWLVSFLSLSSRYEEVRKVVEEYVITARDTLQNLMTSASTISAAQGQLATLLETREKIRSHRAELETQLGSVLRVDPKVSEEIEKLRLERNRIETDRDEYSGKVNALKAKKSVLEVELRGHTGTLSSLHDALERKAREIEGLPSREDIEKAEREARTLRINEIPKLREEIGGLKKESALLEPALSWVSKETSSVPCPLCQSVGANPAGVIPVPNLVRAMQRARDQERALVNKLAQTIQRAGDLESRGPLALRSKEKLEKERAGLNADFQRLTRVQDDRKRELEATSAVLTNRKRDLEAKESELEDILAKLNSLLQQHGDERRSQAIQEIRKAESELGEVEGRISSLQSSIAERATVEVHGSPLGLNDAIAFYEQSMELFTRTISHMDEAIAQQRRGAAKSFNDQVIRLLKEMQFKGLSAWIDEVSYRLKVQREGPAGLIDQAVASLSASERHVLAAVLTIAAKEAYTPEVPFFLIDEVLLDFDKKRLSALVNYLKESAMGRGQLVLLSRLGGETLTVQQVEGV